MVTRSPAFPSSGVSLSSLGASPKQEGAFPAVSAEANFGAAAVGASAFVRTRAGLFAFFACLTGSAAQVPAGLIAVLDWFSGPGAGRANRCQEDDQHADCDRDARSLSDIAVRDEAKKGRADARPQASKNWRRIRWNTLRLFRGREQSRCLTIVRRSRAVNVGQGPKTCCYIHNRPPISLQRT